MSRTNRSNKIMSVKSHTTICATCLSSDRILYPMKLLPHLLNICNGITLTMKDNICWECKAQLLKILKFKNRAVRSQSLLACLANIKRVATSTSGQQGVFLQSLSSLSKNKLFHWGVGSDTDIKEEVIEVEIKDEELNDNAENAESLTKVEESEFIPLKSSTELELSANSDKEGSNRETTDKANVEGITTQTIDEEEREAPDKDDPNSFSVKVLDEVEMMQYREEEKNKRWYKSSKYKCGTCIQTFPNVLVLEKHNELHSEKNGTHACTVCQQRFQFEHAMKIHTRAHYKYYKCRDCDFIHQHQDNMLAHWKRKHDYRIRQCDQCDAQFNLSRSLTYHKELKHKALPRCDICSREFTQKSTLKRHMLVHMDVPKVECTICHKQYRGELRLRLHMKQLHSTSSNKANDEAYCAECGTQFKNIYVYQTHLKVSRKHAAPDTDRFECSECGYKYFTKYFLQHHIETAHLKLGNYPCDICKAKFNSYNSLTRHKRDKHSNRQRKRYVCHVCGKSFAITNSLKDHMNSHTGARPYKCDVCGDTFAYSACLFTHNRLVHLKQKRGKKATGTHA